MFFSAWVMQNMCHRHLAGLKKYSLPEWGPFRFLISPHYTFEILLYLSLAVITAPSNHMFNRTLLCATFFVAVNLGATANGTKKWYVEKFGTDKVDRKWKIVPLVY